MWWSAVMPGPLAAGSTAVPGDQSAAPAEPRTRPGAITRTDRCHPPRRAAALPGRIGGVVLDGRLRDDADRRRSVGEVEEGRARRGAPQQPRRRGERLRARRGLEVVAD